MKEVEFFASDLKDIARCNSPPIPIRHKPVHHALADENDVISKSGVGPGSSLEYRSSLTSSSALSHGVVSKSKPCRIFS